MTRKRALWLLATLSLIAILPTAARAADGDTVTATINFCHLGDSAGYNYYYPNVQNPPYQYYSPKTENAPYLFSFTDTQNSDTASFAGNTLTIQDEVLTGKLGTGACGWGQQFADLTNPITSVTLVSDNFTPDITYSVSNGVLTVNWAGEQNVATTFQAVFNLIGSNVAVPEPAALSVLGLALAGLGVAIRRRRTT